MRIQHESLRQITLQTTTADKWDYQYQYKTDWENDIDNLDKLGFKFKSEVENKKNCGLGQVVRCLI